ncbi:hypothetical protein M9Y10_012431 [Tritrichomonas musculus]|uniref:Amino acid transporter transmembrane domain-containing protein n=1 Tax=Tritrichomonas musculus TaxID=1915356 RepID=A0ABR2IDV8_9EUKA
MQSSESGKFNTEPLLSTEDKDSGGEKNKITLFRAVAVLTNVITGVGLLGIPYCFCSGIGTNLIIILSIASLSCFSFSILIDCERKTNVIDYPRMIRNAFPFRNLQWIPDLATVLLMFGGTILYLQFSSSMLISVLEEKNGVPAFLKNRWFVVFVLQFAIDLPLVLLKSMHSLSFVSLLSVALIACYIFHSIYYFSKSVHPFDPKGQLKIFKFDINQVLPSLAIQASSYTCHPSIFPTLVKLENPTKFRENLVMLLVTICATTLYLVGGIFPYLTLFNDIKDPIVLNYYPKGQVFTFVIKICYSIILVLTTPILIFATRLSVNDLLFSSEMSPMRHNIIGIVLLMLAGLIAVTVTKVNLIFGVVGGISAPLLIYILPSLYYLNICKEGSKVKRAVSWFSLVLGPIFITVCLYDSVKTIINTIKGK